MALLTIGPAPAPEFDDPLGVLRACHRRMERQLATLTRLRKHLPLHHADQDARVAAAATIRYFDIAAKNHHEDEEASLLPRLLELDPALKRLVADLLRDHDDLGARWLRMRPLLTAISVGRSGHLPVRDVEAFCARYRTHIAREEGELLVRAADILDAPTLAQIGTEMAERRNLR
jgi:hemerythrin-like domain-containing protein